MAREIAILPLFFTKGYPGQTSRLGAGSVLGLVALGIAPCSCFCINAPLQLALTVIAWLPLIWAAPVISREIDLRTWELLRSTPYSSAEIVMAKWSAVFYTLLPSLGPLIIGQIGSLLALGLYALTDISDGLFFFANGAALVQGGSASDDEWGVRFGVFAVIGLLTLITPVVDYLTNITIGVLGSALVGSRNAAYAAAFILRLGVTLTGFLVSGLIASIFSQGWQSPFVPVLASVVVGTPGWTSILMYQSPLIALAAALIVFACQIGLFALMLAVLLWRAERL